LCQGYWSSYNIPYFEAIFDASEYPEKEKKFGDLESYDKNPRALIFARNASGINTLEDMKRLMQYNEYQSDALSMGVPV